MEFESDITLGESVTLPENATVTILYNGNHIRDTKPIVIPATTTLVADVITNQFETVDGYVINWKTTGSNPHRVTYTVAPSTWPVTIRSANGDEVRYEDLVSAEKAMDDGDTMIINEDMTGKSISFVAPNPEVDRTGTIDLNGKTVQGVSSAGCWTTTVTGDGVVSNTASSATKAASAYGGKGVLIIENGTFTGGIALHSAPGYNETTAEAIVNGGTFTGTSKAIKIEKAGGSSRTNYGKITINGGVFNGEIAVPEGAEENLVIRGGTFTVDPAAYVDTENYSVVADAEAGTWTVAAK